MLQDDRNNKTTIVLMALLTVLGLIYYLPIFSMPGINRCDDTTFHLGRLVGLSNVFSSPVNFNSFGNNGLMVNIFYPWLTMYPMRLLYTISSSYVLAYKLFYTILSIATSIIGYCAIKSISKDKIAGFIFAVLYTFSNYRYVDIFKRDALGEAIAITFLPIVLLGIYKVFFDNFSDYKYLVIGMTLIAYSHLLSLAMSALFIAGLLILSILFWNHKKERLLALAKATILSAGLSLAMILPMIEQFSKNNLFKPGGSGKTLAKSSYSIIEMILSSVKNSASWKGIGLLAIAAATLAIVMLAILIIQKQLDGHQYLVIFMIYGIVIFIAMSDIIPWRWIGNNTVLASVQFVWRFNSYPTLLFMTVFSICISMFLKTKKMIIMALAGIVLISCGLHYYNLGQHRGMPDKDPIIEKEVATWSSRNADYAPIEAEEYREKNGKTMEYMYIDGEEIEENPIISNNGSTYLVHLGGSDKNRIVDIPVYKFESQILRINGKREFAQLSERGTTQLTVPASEEVTIEIEYKYSIFARMSWLISIALALLLLGKNVKKEPNN